MAPKVPLIPRLSSVTRATRVSAILHSTDRTLIAFQALTTHTPSTQQPQNHKPVKPVETKPAQKTQAELDEELRQKLDAISGEGGEAGVEYENGQPVAMKRAVKENMFRVI